MTTFHPWPGASVKLRARRHPAAPIAHSSSTSAPAERARPGTPSPETAGRRLAHLAEHRAAERRARRRAKASRDRRAGAGRYLVGGRRRRRKAARAARKANR